MKKSFRIGETAYRIVTDQGDDKNVFIVDAARADTRRHVVGAVLIHAGIAANEAPAGRLLQPLADILREGVPVINIGSGPGHAVADKKDFDVRPRRPVLDAAQPLRVDRDLGTALSRLALIRLRRIAIGVVGIKENRIAQAQRAQVDFRTGQRRQQQRNKYHPANDTGAAGGWHGGIGLGRRTARRS
jgi:hypothetical protein